MRGRAKELCRNRRGGRRERTFRVERFGRRGTWDESIREADKKVREVYVEVLAGGQVRIDDRGGLEVTGWLR